MKSIWKLAVAVATVVLSVGAHAADGDLDLSYDTDGVNSVSFGASDIVYAGLLQADGKLIAIGGGRPVTNQEFSAARFNINGSLDTGFANSGKFSLDVTPTTTTDRATCGGQQSDGKIIIGGYTRVGAGDDDFAIIRLTTAGVLDTTFGTAGVVKVNFNGGTDRANALRVLPDNRIVVAGFALDSNGSLDQDLAVAMLTANGALDTSFSGDGKQTVDVGTQVDDAQTVAVQSDGKIVAAGAHSSGGPTLPLVVRLTASGAPDTTFGGGDGYFSEVLGTSIGDNLEAVEVQADGKIVVSGRSAQGGEFKGLIARFTAVGALDTTFNSTGFNAIDLGSGSDSLDALELQADGKYALGGYWVNPSGGLTETVLVRVGAAGSVDNSFGTGGIRKLSVATGNDRIVDMFLDSSNRLVAALEAGTGGAEDFYTARFLNTVAVTTPSVGIAVAPASVLEDGITNLVYTVTSSANVTSATTINITTGGTATSGTDYIGGVATVVIPNGAATATITLDPTADGAVEANETVILTVAPGAGYTVGTPSSATGTITNDDVAPNLTINDVTVTEGNSSTTNATFTVGLSTPAGLGGVSFDIATANGTATAGSDYLALNLTSQTIPAGSSTYTFTVLVNGDTAVEPNETFFVNVTNVTNAIATDGQGLGTISNDDVPSASIGVAPSLGVAEDGAAVLTYTVTLDQQSPNSTSVNFAATGTAASGSDYSAVTSPLVIPPNTTSGVITIDPTSDSTTEPDETVILTLTAGAGYAVGAPASATGTILNDDATVSLTGSAVVSESIGTHNLTVTLNSGAPLAQAATVQVNLVDNTAVFNAAVGDMFLAGPSNTQIVSFPAGSLDGATRTVAVIINDDRTAESSPASTAPFNVNESFTATLSVPTGGVSIASGSATVSIDENDFAYLTVAAPQITANEAISPVTSNIRVRMITVGTGVEQVQNAFAVPLQNSQIGVGPGLATVLDDFDLQTAVVNVPAGALNNSDYPYQVAIVNDAIDEPDEFFDIIIVRGNYSGVPILVPPNANNNCSVTVNPGLINNPCRDRQTIRIADNDTVGIVLAQSAGSTDVTEGSTTDSYTLVLTSQPSNDVSIVLNPGTQVTVATSPVVFTAGNWNVPQTVTVTAVDDTTIEGPHTGTVSHTVTSTDTSYNNFSVSNVVASITDNDLPTLAINDVSIAEGNSATQILTFTVTRTGLSASAVGFDFTTADDTATIADNDYVLASGTDSIAGGGATGSTTVSVTISGDAVFENTERFFVNLSAPTNATIADNQGIGTISNDDTAPTLAINDVSIVEGNSGTASLVFTVTRTGLTALPASFTATTANDTATAPSDYQSTLAGSTSIAAGGATATTTLTATISGDAVVEGNETFFVNLSAAANATIADNQGIGTISNDDTAGITLVQSGSTDVTEGGPTDSYTLVLTSQPTANVSIGLSGTQVSAAPTPVVFTSGNWNVPQTVTVTAIDDNVVEGNHTGSVTSVVSSGDGNYNASALAAVTVAITDNDAPGASVVQSGGTTAATEGGATDTYTVVLTSQPSSNVTITPTGTEVSASAPLVFTNGNWNVPQTVTVTALDDNVVEGTHSGSISHAVSSSDGNYGGLSIAGVPGISITDNDSAVVAFNPITQSQSEGASPLAFTVTLSNPVQSGVTLAVNSTPGSASAADFTPISAGTVSFPAGSTTSQTVNVVINNDALDEADEDFTLTLSNLTATGNVTLGTATATGTIQDDDATPTISISSPSQAEGNAGTSTMNFVVSLSAVSGRDVDFTRVTADGTATLGNNDYVALLPGPASIPAGQGSINIPVTINGDTVFEGNESFSLNLSGVVNATPGTLSGSGTIQDDDQQPTTTTITGAAPEPSQVAQPYVVSVTVRAQSTSPLGSVTIREGVAGPSCTANLTAGTAPDSSASCALTASSAGSKNLTADYLPASSAFAASSGSAVHQVVPASTFKGLIASVTPSRFGEPVTFSAQLSGVDPTGTVEFFVGASSLGTAPLTASPSGGVNLKLASLTVSSLPVGPGNIRVVYAGDANNAPSSSPDLAHTVIPANTRISLTPASNPASVGPLSVAIQVSADAPGGGVPQGSVTLSAGAITCTAALTAGAGSCSLNLTATGYTAISASYTPGNGNHSASSGGTGVIVSPANASADLRVRIGNGVRIIDPNQPVNYLIVVDNLGADPAVGRLQVPLSVDFPGATYSCLSAGPSACGRASGTGSIDTDVSLAPGGAVIYTLSVISPLAPERPLSQSATLSIRSPGTDPDLSNNSATDADSMGLFADGLEDASVEE